MHWIRLAPMTAESLIVCVAIYATCLSQSTSKHKSFADVQRDLGAICPLELSEAHDGMRRAKEPELFGPFDVWDGGWWRIPMTVFHHQDLLHLVLNLGAAWYLGRRLEAGWGSFATGMFLIPAILLPVMAELCLGQPMIGFSGVVCAMLGALVALRQFDVKFADTFSEDAAEIGVALIVLGWLATSCEFVVLPNTAHITGFLYGVLIGGTCGGPFRRVALLRVSVILVHLWVAPGLFLVCHPYWIGRYSWYQAISSRNPQRTERSLERALERAIACDPSLTGAWLRCSQLAEARGDQREAWKRLIKGLAFNPGSESLIDGARRLWRHLDGEHRRQAELVLIHFFGKHAAVWLQQIRRDKRAPVDYNEKESNIDVDHDVNEYALDQKIQLPLMDFLPLRSNQQKPKDPIDQIDAEEGKTL